DGAQLAFEQAGGIAAAIAAFVMFAYRTPDQRRDTRHKRQELVGNQGVALDGTPLLSAEFTALMHNGRVYVKHTGIMHQTREERGLEFSRGQLQVRGQRQA